MYPKGSRVKLVGLIALICVSAFSGCASPVPGGNGASALSGRSLQVKLVFNGPINPNYFYYFIINASNDPSGPGPIPVGSPISSTTYGNGFATGSDSRSGDFTDFVLYSNTQYPNATPAANYALYHVLDGKDGNVRTNFVANGAPIQYVPPQSPTNNTLIFQIDLAQLYTSSNSQADAVNKAKNLRYLQVNVVSTNVVPLDTQTSVIKEYDSFGNDSNGVGNFLNMDLNQLAYKNGNGDTPTTTEPSFNDVFISPVGSNIAQDPSLDLVDWEIQVITTG